MRLPPPATLVIMALAPHHFVYHGSLRYRGMRSPKLAASSAHSGHSPRTQNSAAYLLELSDRRAAFVRVHQFVGRFEKIAGCRAVVRIKRKSDTC